MLLEKEVEKRSGLKVKTSRDFEILAETIIGSGAGYISPSTLKRLWGYVTDTKKKNISTLDVLARYAGYPKGFQEFSKKVESDMGVESGFDNKHVADLLLLEPGTRIEVEWLPDRRVVFCCLGDCMLRVEESVNSKLECGDTVRCARIIQGEKLIVDLVQEKNGRRPLVYEAGKVNGVSWRLI